MTKSEIRKIYKQKRILLTETEAGKMQDLLMISFQQLSLPFVEYLHSYLPIDTQKEVDTYPVMEFLKFGNPGLKIVTPKTDFENNTMTSLLFNEHTLLEKNKYDIMEPVSGEAVEPMLIDMVLVPLLSFSADGYRVGYGKGFYDRFLSECREDVIKIGLSFFDAGPHIDDTDEFDIPLTYCVTPHTVYEF